jgi:hypothetical protein
MSLRTVESLIGAANGAKDLQSMAANFLVNFLRHANGVGGVEVTANPFVVVPVAVSGTADEPRLTFALVSTERTTWQVADYLSPDDDGYSESWGADNSCGYHIKSEERQREQRITIAAGQLLMPNDAQIKMMQAWKLEAEAEKKERARLSNIAALRTQLSTLEAEGAAQDKAKGGGNGN